MKINCFENYNENQIIVFCAEADWAMTTNGDPIYSDDADDTTAMQAANLWSTAHEATEDELEAAATQSAGLANYIASCI